MKNLGKFLQDTRNEKNMSLRDFAKMLNISHSYLDKLEKSIDSKNNKEIEPTIITLEKIATALGLNLKELLINVGYISNEPLPPNYENAINEIVDNEYNLAIKSAKELKVSAKELIKLMRIYKED